MMKFRTIALAAALLICTAAFGQDQGDDDKRIRISPIIPIEQLYGIWALVPACDPHCRNPVPLDPHYGPPTLFDPVLIKTDKQYRTRAIAQVFQPVYREELVHWLDPRLPPNVISVYMEAVGPGDELITYGPVEQFVAISQDEIVYVFPRPGERARKVIGLASSP